MTDYTELVKALRCCATMTCKGEECKYMILGCHDCFPKLHDDAADAIEALIADVEKKESRITGLGNRIFALEQQLPKRGEWIKRHEFVEDMRFDGFRCSICNWWKGDFETYNYCPRCGAKMDGEV